MENGDLKALWKKADNLSKPARKEDMRAMFSQFNVRLRRLDRLHQGWLAIWIGVFAIVASGGFVLLGWHSSHPLTVAGAMISSVCIGIIIGRMYQIHQHNRMRDMSMNQTDFVRSEIGNLDKQIRLRKFNFLTLALLIGGALVISGVILDNYTITFPLWKMIILPSLIIGILVYNRIASVSRLEAERDELKTMIESMAESG